MSEKNPYENQETVDIPNFSSTKKGTIDTSSFRVDEEEYEDDEDYYEDEPTYRKVRKPIIVAAIILLVVLLIVSVVSLISASKAKKQLASLQEEYDAYVERAKANENALNEKIVALQTQTSPIPTPSGDPGQNVAKYIVDVDQLSIRVGAGTNNDYASYSSLPDNVRESCDEASGNALTHKGATFDVLEIKTIDNGSIWGKIADNAWICLNDGADDFCKKQ